MLESRGWAASVSVSAGRASGTAFAVRAPSPVIGRYQGELADAQAAVATLRDWAVSLRMEGMAVLRGYQAGLTRTTTGVLAAGGKLCVIMAGFRVTVIGK